MLLFRIALRNLWLHKLKTIVVGCILLVGTSIVIVGNSLLDAVDKSMAVSIVNSISGHLQVHSSEAPDELALFGSMDGSAVDLGMIADFPKVKAELEKLENVKTVVPMGLNFAVVASGNVFDRKLSSLRQAVRDKDEKRISVMKKDVERIVGVLAKELEGLGKLADMERVMSRGKDKLEALETVQKPEFWADFDNDRFKAVELLENKVAPLALDADLLWLRYIGTNTKLFEETFDRFEIAKGERIPPGKRGFMFNEQIHEKWVKNKTARRLDRIKQRVDEGELIAECDDCKQWMEMNRAQASSLIYQLDSEAAKAVGEGLRSALKSDETDLVTLFKAFHDMDDTNFLERYDFFYKTIAPNLVLYTVNVGDTITLTAFGKGGYTRKVPVKVYGTFRFKSLDKSPLAAGFNLMDLITFRDLYGYMTKERLAEIETIREDAEVADVDADNAEDALFGDDSALVEEAEAKAFDETAGLDMSMAGEEFNEALDNRVYTDEEFERGVVLNAAIVLKDATDLDAAIKEIEEASAKADLNLTVVSWRKAAGMVGEFISIIRVVLYSAVFIIFVVALIIINNSLVMSTLERTREIGTMRAIGAQRSFIMQMFLVETGVLAVVFGGLGAVMGTGIMLYLGSAGIAAFNDVSLFLFAGPRLFPELMPYHLLTALIVIAFVSVASTWYPARLATRITPITAMQKED